MWNHVLHVNKVITTVRIRLAENKVGSSSLNCQSDVRINEIWSIDSYGDETRVLRVQTCSFFIKPVVLWSGFERYVCQPYGKVSCRSVFMLQYVTKPSENH